MTSITRHLPGKTFKNVTPLIRRMRLVKDTYEIAALRKAAEISGLGLITVMRNLRAGLNDREIAGLMEYTWKQAGSPRPSFAPVVASGPNSMTFFSLMGERYNSVDHTMRDGELLFIDYGAAEYQTYASDLCRTLPVSGTFTPDQRKYYEIVLEAQEAAIDRIKPGVMMIDAIKAAAEVFHKHGLERYEDIKVMGEDKVWGIMPSPTHYLTRNAGLVPYTPRGVGVRDLGHHIGLHVHDSRDYSRPLEAGMVVTVEPKIYIPEKQIAIMIEDMVLVTPERPRGPVGRHVQEGGRHRTDHEERPEPGAPQVRGGGHVSQRLAHAARRDLEARRQGTISGDGVQPRKRGVAHRPP